MSEIKPGMVRVFDEHGEHWADPPPDPMERRIATLERQVDLLRRAMGLLTVSSEPTVTWLNAEWNE